MSDDLNKIRDALQAKANDQFKARRNRNTLEATKYYDGDVAITVSWDDGSYRTIILTEKQRSKFIKFLELP